MRDSVDDRLTRIGVFYDGGFFSEVSNYYRYFHERKMRLSVTGLHRFVKHSVAEAEGADERYCRVVDAHYFRGRFTAESAEQHKKLKSDRQFEDVLMRAGVITHYLPRSVGKETGIDVWFALEAFELAIYKRFNVLVLVGGDGDYVPLVRKLNTLGTRVMLLGWDFEYRDAEGRPQTTNTSRVLKEEVTYPVAMQDVIDDPARKDDPVIDGLFVPRRDADDEGSDSVGDTPSSAMVAEGRRGRIKLLHAKQGYIADDSEVGRDWLFLEKEVVDGQWSDLKEGDAVEFTLVQGSTGLLAQKVRYVKASSSSGS